MVKNLHDCLMYLINEYMEKVQYDWLVCTCIRDNFVVILNDCAGEQILKVGNILRKN